MQVTTLNKIINLFLVGTFATFLLIVFVAHIFRDFIPQSELVSIKSAVETIGAPTMVVISTFALLSIGIMIGIITDAISNLIFTKLVKLAIKNRYIRVLLASNDLYKKNHFLHKKFRQKFAAVNKYERLNKERNVTKAYATAIFFNTANKENIEWATQHYSVYLLSVNYLFILLIALVITSVLPITILWKLSAISVILIGMYGLFFQAVHKYLYTYEVTFRHCAIILSAEIEEQKEHLALKNQRQPYSSVIKKRI